MPPQCSTANPFCHPSRSPKFWGVLYAQVLQADGKAHRNILLGEKKLYRGKRDWPQAGLLSHVNVYGMSHWTQDEVMALPEAMGLPEDSPLSGLAVELYRNYEAVAKPLGSDLGKLRICRTSRLQPVLFMCPC